jgi:hypothetical protein
MLQPIEDGHKKVDPSGNLTPFAFDVFAQDLGQPDFISGLISGGNESEVAGCYADWFPCFL